MRGNPEVRIRAGLVELTAEYPALSFLFNGVWLTAAGVSFVVYLALTPRALATGVTLTTPETTTETR